MGVKYVRQVLWWTTHDRHFGQSACRCSLSCTYVILSLFAVFADTPVSIVSHIAELYSCRVRHTWQLHVPTNRVRAISVFGLVVHPSIAVIQLAVFFQVLHTFYNHSYSVGYIIYGASWRLSFASRKWVPYDSILIICKCFSPLLVLRFAYSYAHSLIMLEFNFWWM